MSAAHLISYALLTLIHKINIIGKPISLKDLLIYRHKDNVRGVRSPESIAYKPKSQRVYNTAIYRAHLLYSKIPESIKMLNLEIYKKQIKTYIKEKLPPDRINTYKDYI